MNEKLDELLAPPPTKAQLVGGLLSKIPQGRAQVVNALLRRQLAGIYQSFTGAPDPSAPANVQSGATAVRENREGLESVLIELEKLNRPR